jgi:hypothetical protein
MQERLSDLSVTCLHNLNPRNELRVRQYAIGYHLNRLKACKTSKECRLTTKTALRNSLKNLRAFKAKHPELVDTKVKQMSLSI